MKRNSTQNFILGFISVLAIASMPLSILGMEIEPGIKPIQLAATDQEVIRLILQSKMKQWRSDTFTWQDIPALQWACSDLVKLENTIRVYKYDLLAYCTIHKLQPNLDYENNFLVRKGFVDPVVKSLYAITVVNAGELFCGLKYGEWEAFEFVFYNRRLVAIAFKPTRDGLQWWTYTYRKKYLENIISQNEESTRFVFEDASTRLVISNDGVIYYYYLQWIPEISVALEKGYLSDRRYMEEKVQFTTLSHPELHLCPPIRLWKQPKEYEWDARDDH